MKFLITGSSGFIGFHLSKYLLEKGNTVIGLDNHLNDEGYNSKLQRLRILKKFSKFKFKKIDLSNNFAKKKFEKIDFLIHLAAQPGVRVSVDKPIDCVKNNILSFIEVIEFVKINKIKNFIYASSSTVYGERDKNFTENFVTNNPKSIYAISKLNNEITAKFYSDNFNINSIGIRFFSIYGPYGRKDMSYYKFVDDIFNKKKIFINGNGKIKRSFTHIDDAVICLVKLIKKYVKIKKYSEIFNIGHEESVSINKVVSLIKNKTKKKFKVIYKKKVKVDNRITKTNINKLFKTVNFKPKKKLDKGIEDFINWYLKSKN